MATFIPGMACSISGKTITRIENAVVFPAFVANEADPIYVFSDAVIDADVFRKHPLAGEAQSRYKDFRRHNTPESRVCAVCDRQIVDPDDYIGLGHLVSDSEEHTSELQSHSFISYAV